MTYSQPVELVVELLTSVGYRKCEVPFTVASMSFEFDAVLAGADRALDLVVIIDTLREPDSRVRQKMEGLSRALDLVASRRPLTAVLVGPPPRIGVLNAISRVCRLLQVWALGESDSNERLRDALAVLLPLDVPDVSETVVDPLAEVRRRTMSVDGQKLVSALLQAAPDGSEAVKSKLRKLLAEPLGASNPDQI
jgi:hypothetical protein